jgi:hypothetical protein
MMTFELWMLNEIKRMKTNQLESDKNKLKTLEELAIAYGNYRVFLFEQMVQEGILTADVHRDVDAAVNVVGDDIDDAAGDDVGDAVDVAGAVDVPEE